MPCVGGMVDVHAQVKIIVDDIILGAPVNVPSAVMIVYRDVRFSTQKTSTF